MRFALFAERNAGYFTLTLALPMTLILFLAWMVHLLPVDVIPTRMGTASATVFSLIAFGVSFRLTLPKIAYLTDADRFVLYSTMLVLASLAVTVVGVRLVGAEKKDAAERLTRQARLVFPFIYGLIVVLVCRLKKGRRPRGIAGLHAYPRCRIRTYKQIRQTACTGLARR